MQRRMRGCGIRTRTIRSCVRHEHVSTKLESIAMRSRLRYDFGFGLFLPVLVLALSACGSSSSSSGMPGIPGMSPGGQSTSGSGSPPAGAARTVTLTLSDFKITSSQTAFVSGTTYHFVVTNSSKSTTSHEVMAMKPLNGDHTDMGGMDKMALFSIDQSKLAPGQTRTIDYTFTSAAAATQLEFACHVGSHYQLGMRLPITVATK